MAKVTGAKVYWKYNGQCRRQERGRVRSRCGKAAAAEKEEGEGGRESARVAMCGTVRQVGRGHPP